MAYKKNRSSGEHHTEMKKLVPNEGQKLALNGLRVNGQLILIGGAGTGKTYLSMYAAATFYSEHSSHKIVLSRPNEPAGRTLGHFPGSKDEKMGEWVREPIAVLTEFLGPGTVETGLKNGRIELVPLETMRGRSFKDSFVVLDEAQNITPAQALMFWTRMDQNSKAVMNGDLQQSDIRGENGLEASIICAEDWDAPALVVELEQVERDPKVMKWIKAFKEYDNDETA
jgi:phosphate starvation-inducible PhoH-like protein